VGMVAWLPCYEEESFWTLKVSVYLLFRRFCVMRLIHCFETANGRKNGIQLSLLLNSLFQEGYVRLCALVKGMTPCQVLSITEDINIIEDGQIEILLTAMVSAYVVFCAVLDCYC
jgi:hypothetical protein